MRIYNHLFFRNMDKNNDNVVMDYCKYYNQYILSRFFLKSYPTSLSPPKLFYPAPT